MLRCRIVLNGDGYGFAEILRADAFIGKKEGPVFGFDALDGVGIIVFVCSTARVVTLPEESRLRGNGILDRSVKF